MLGKNLIQAAAGNIGAAGGLGIEDVFSTWLYTGNGSTQTITNGIDLAGEGGLVWLKSRSSFSATEFRQPDHFLTNTTGSSRNFLSSNKTDASAGFLAVSSFNSNGFSLDNQGDGASFGGRGNLPGVTYASWTFRKAPKFFDVVTYTGNGSTQSISHNLGSIPGFIIVKRTDSTGNWICWHRSIGSSGYILLNSPGSQGGTSGAWPWNNTAPTDATFTVGYAVGVNTAFQPNLSGATYVAYLFAHDAGGFGDDGTESVIKCGSFNDASAGSVDLGWEPQWILWKPNVADNWKIVDNMRGFLASGSSTILYPNSASAESGANVLTITSTGFNYPSSNSTNNFYIAIRRGPMKTPTSGTEVFDADTYSSTGSITTGFPVDLILARSRASVSDCFAGARITGNNVNLKTTSTATEGLATNGWNFASNTSIEQQYSVSGVAWNFRRAPGFFDVVTYTGNGDAGRYVNHGLAAAPEMIITKCRNSSGGNWVSTHKDLNNYRQHIYLNSNLEQSPIQDFYTEATSSSYRVWKVTGQGVDANNAGGENYIAYLFATLPGISKCFNYTGNGTSQTIDCGFAAGARFVLLKRTDSAGNWLVADTARGIVNGNDPLLYLNSTAAEITTLDWIDPHSSGFIVNQEATANANVGGATYIGLAIA